MSVVIVFGGVSELIGIISGTVGEGLLFAFFIGSALSGFEFGFMDGMIGKILDWKLLRVFIGLFNTFCKGLFTLFGEDEPDRHGTGEQKILCLIEW